MALTPEFAGQERHMSTRRNSSKYPPADLDPKVAHAVLSAAKKGDLAALRAAIDADPALLLVRDKDGSTPLHCASWKGHQEVVS